MGSFIHLVGVKEFMLDVSTEPAPVNNMPPVDIPAIVLDGTTSDCGNGRIDGFFQGAPGSQSRVIAAVGSMFDIRVRGTMNAYAGWVPSVASPSYTGTLVCNPKDVLPVTADEVSVTVTPTGPANAAVLDLTFVQSPYVVINASAVNIVLIIPYGGTGANNGQWVTLECDFPNVVLQHNATQLMPGQTNFQFTQGSTIDLYRINGSVWRSVGVQ